MNTGGALSGTGRGFKAQKPDMQVVALDPVASVYFDNVKSGTRTEHVPR